MQPCQVQLLANTLGLASTGLTRLISGTNSVWLLDGVGVVLRVAGPDVEQRHLISQVWHARALIEAGAPFVAPTVGPQPVTAGGLHATVWAHVPPTGAVDFASFGRAARALHSAEAAARVAAVSRRYGTEMPDALDAAALEVRIGALATSGVATVEQLRVLAPWPARMATQVAALPAAPRCVVHDDLYAKNVIQSAAGAVLSDPDNLAWGRPDYDLAFVTRAAQAGSITAAEADAFASGYGSALPDVDTAWVLARFHRLRWVCLLLERARWMPSAAAVLAREIPAWANPNGPQPPTTGPAAGSQL